MYKRIISLMLLFVLFMIGCVFQTSKDIKLTENIFSKLDSSMINEIEIISYGKPLIIKDFEKIDAILKCIKEADRIDDNGKQAKSLFIFKTSKKTYFMNISWDDTAVYGNWWKSAVLLKSFEQWGIFDELHKSFSYWMKNPPPESDPNFPPNKLPWNRVSGLRMNPYRELTPDTFTILDFSKVRDLTILTKLGKDGYVFPVNDPEKIRIVLKCIQDTNQLDYDVKRTDNTLYLVIEDMIFYTGIGWDAETVYGDWWESKELLASLKDWDNNFPE